MGFFDSVGGLVTSMGGGGVLGGLATAGILAATVGTGGMAGVIVAGAGAGIAIGSGVYQHENTKIKTAEARHDNKVANDKNTRMQKTLVLKQYNQALAASNRESLGLELEMADHERQAAAKGRFYGSPAVPS